MKMSDEFEEQLVIDRQKIKNAVRLLLPIELTTYTLPRNMEVYFRKILQIFLEECHQTQLFDYLHFCLGELLTNSKKANTKRVYFKEKNLDINNPSDYEKGMETFRDDTFSNIDYYMQLQKKAGLYVKLSMQITSDSVIIEIKNNSLLTDIERARIDKKLQSVHQYNNMEEVIANVLDQTEGAGLGIIIIILMLQKVGLSKDNYTFYTNKTETINRIELPCNQKIFAAEDLLVHEFIKAQTTIPVIKENIASLRQLISSGADKQEIYKLLLKDPSLSLLLLKQAATKSQELLSVKQALEQISAQELKDLYDSSNSEIREFPESDELKALLEHSSKSALAAYNLAKNSKEVLAELSPEQVATIALVNNFGMILLKTASTEQMELVKKLSLDYEEPEVLVDIFQNGNVSSYLAMIYKQKLGLNNDLNLINAFWNVHTHIPQQYKNTAKALYVAEVMQYYKENQADFFQLDKEALKLFGINNETQFELITNQIASVY